MERRRMKKCLLMLMLAGWVGCGDSVEGGNQETVELREESWREVAAVIPVFQVSGLGSVDEAIILDKLGLVIAEIRLEPLDGDGGVAFSTTRPFELVFDLSQGAQAQEYQEVEIPQTGHFLVSVRVEPVEGEGEFGLPDGRVASVGMEGRVRSDAREDVGEDGDGKPLPLPFDGRHSRDEDADDEDDSGDGKPLPLPFDSRRQAMETPEEWTSFRYSSQDVVYFTFSEVELVEGSQKLVFDFDLSAWIDSLSEPVARAVSQAQGNETANRGPIDISSQLDSPDVLSYPEGLLEQGHVFNVPAMP